MTAEIPQVVAERRMEERRRDWHTPEDCFKLLDVQSMVDKIFARLDDDKKRMDSIFGHIEEANVRMGCLEDNVAGNHRVVSEDIKELEATMREHRKALDENTEKTNQTFEIIEMGKGFFKGIAFTGKWTRRIVMWVVPPVAAIVGLWQSFMDRH